MSEDQTDYQELFLSNELGNTITFKEIEETFEFLDDWEERYAYIIDLGKKLPVFPENEKTEAHKIHGCQSQVWLIHHFDKTENRLCFLIDSDALIVRGLAAIVLCIFNRKPKQDIMKTEIEDAFLKLDLLRHISATRGNGLRSMVKKIQTIAENLPCY